MPVCQVKWVLYLRILCFAYLFCCSITSFRSIFQIYAFWVPISAVKGPRWVPISLKIRSLLGPHFDKFRSPFHVGAVPSHDSHDIRGSALLPRFSPAEPPNSSSGLQMSLRASQSPSSSADPERPGGQRAIGGEYPKGQFLGKRAQSPQLDRKRTLGDEAVWGAPVYFVCSFWGVRLLEKGVWVFVKVFGLTQAIINLVDCWIS